VNATESPDHRHDLTPWQHGHVFDTGNPAAERSVRRVAWLTFAVMFIEIAAGWWTGSMALTADGWHMGTHAAALGATALAYALARRYARDARFTFGTWKIEVLASFGSAVLLALVAAMMVWESIERFVRPQPIAYVEALAVAVFGLLVNLASIWMLHGGQGHAHAHSHSHGHDHDHAGHACSHGHHGHGGHDHGQGDLNFRAAYLHVATDAATSVLAIAALFAGMWWGWGWFDPAMGLVGAALIAYWALGIVRDSSTILLDREMDHPIVERIRAALESDGDAKVADLHVWRVGRDRFAMIACLVADVPSAPDRYRDRLAGLPELAHVSIEVNRCPRVSPVP
jgi:cation diffusion facilitator family transporter